MKLQNYFFIVLIATTLNACKNEETNRDSSKSTMTEFFSFSLKENTIVQAQRHTLTIIDNKQYDRFTTVIGETFEDSIRYALSSDALTFTPTISTNNIFRSYIESDSDTSKTFYLASNNNIKDIKIEEKYEIQQLSGTKISEALLYSGGDILGIGKAMYIIDQKDTRFPAGAACNSLKKSSVNKNYIAFNQSPTTVFNTLDQWQTDKYNYANKNEITDIINGSYQGVEWRKIIYKDRTNDYPTAVLFNGKVYEGVYILASVPYTSEGTGCYSFNSIAANAISDSLKSLY